MQKRDNAAYPSNPDSQLAVGVTYLSSGAPRLALEYFQSVISADPNNALAQYNAGVALYTLESFEQSIRYFRQAITLCPDFQQAYHNLAQAYTQCRLYPTAITAYEMALQLNPNDANSSYNLGILHQQLGNQDKMMAAYQRALSTRPDFHEVYSALGIYYNQQNQMDEAIICLDQALNICPDSAEAHLNMGIALQKSGAYEMGLSHYKQALIHKPDYAPARWLSLLSLPMLYQHEDEIDAYRNQFAFNLDHLIADTPLNTTRQKHSALKGVGTTTNFFLQYQCCNDLVFQAKYGRFANKVMTANFPQWSRIEKSADVKPGGHIRIGYVSSFMHNHTIGIFLKGWLQAHQQSNFEIFCYHVGTKVDQTTTHLSSLCHHFHHIPGDIEAASTKIAEDDLHILTYTDIGMEPITMQLASLRLAPIQCKGWGHPVTTGLPTIDFYLSSDLMEPDDGEAHYSETLVRLPNLALNYHPPALPQAPKTRRSFGIPQDRFVYLSTQSIFKYLPQHDDIYPLIAKAVPRACFVFIGHDNQKATTQFKNRLAGVFANFGLAADHYCHFSNKLEYNDFLSLNLAADVLLDSLEWSGGKTTLEAICCGLPVVTCPGRFMRGRHAYAMLTMMGLTSTVANDKSNYCAIASRLANDSAFYDNTRQSLLSKRTRLYCDKVFVQGLNRFYQQILAA